MTRCILLACNLFVLWFCLGFAPAAELNYMVLNVYVQNLNAPDPATRTRTIDKLKQNPQHLQAVLENLEKRLTESIEGYRKANLSAKKTDLITQSMQAFAQHAEQKKVVGKNLSPPRTSLTFLS